MFAKIMIVIEIQIIFPLFSSSPTIFIISSLAVRTLGNSVGVAFPQPRVAGEARYPICKQRAGGYGKARKQRQL